MTSRGKDTILIIILVCVALSAFGLGRLSALEQQRPAVTLQQRPSLISEPMRIGGSIVASRKGSKYHYPWCPGARAMSPQNMRWFESVEEARAAGYTPASNCTGLK